MTAICKAILIHGTNLQNILDSGSDQDKTSVTNNGLEDVFDYASNPLKTLANLDDGHKELLVTGVLCQPETAVLDFGIVREKYLSFNNGERYASFGFLDRRTNESRMVHKKPVTAIHLIQSFAETDLDPRTVHQIGIDLCERLGVQAVVDTHMNKEHLHNHIIINAYMPDGVSKFCLTADKRMQIRELSDEIQHEYGIELRFADPRCQLYQSLGKNTYREWSAKRQNVSWKDEMREEMAAIRSVSDNREDFITIMQDYGYQIARHEANSITWWNKAHTRKIRDKTLGAAYELGAMFPENMPEQQMVVGREPEKNKKHSKTISIARYDWNGRRRSDLELLIRKAIALIQHIGNRYQAKSHSSTLSTSRKLQMMEQALDTVCKMGFEDKEDLEKRMDDVGAKLNHIKSQIHKMDGQKAFYDTISPMFSAYQSTKHMVDSIRYWPRGAMPDLMLSSYTPIDIQKQKVTLCPMSGAQKRDLYLALEKHPEYTLSGDGFSSVSAMDAEEIFAFFKGTKAEPPACLRKSIDVTMERVYHKRNEYLKQTFDKPIQKYQITEVSALLSAHGITLDVSALTQFDAINIRNCYGSNPFAEPPISMEQQQYLSKMLSERGLTTNRDIRYILPSEYTKALDYMDGLSRTMPGILKASPGVDAIAIDKLQSFMDSNGITSSIPLSAMSKADYDKMYGYVISQGMVPDCAIPKTVDRTDEFIQSIQVDGITEKKQLLLLQLRNQMNDLQSLGINPANIEPVFTAISEFRQSYEALEMERAELAGEYKALVQLKQQISYAESPSFVFGSLFNEKVHEAPDVVEKDVKDEKAADMPKKTKDIEQNPEL